MALSAKLAMRQGQSMVLTPQLLQAIKLLQMPNLELTPFIENELESNPLLERAEEPEAGAEVGRARRARRSPGRDGRLGGRRSRPTRTVSPPISAPKSKTPSTPTAPRAGASSSAAADGLNANAWTGVGVGSDCGRSAPICEAYVAETVSLRDHSASAAILLADPATG